MSEGKFSQPRPYREEDRQIEESFRQLTEDTSRRRKKAFQAEADMQKAIREMSAPEGPLPEIHALPTEQTIPADFERKEPPKPHPAYGAPPRQNPLPRKTVSAPEPEVPDTFFEGNRPRPKPVFPEPPLFTQEEEPEEEPDFIDKLMHFGEFFRKHQTPVVLGLCGAALLLIVLFVSIFFTGGRPQESQNVLAGNVSIAGVNIGGMTKKQAIDAVARVTDTSYRSTDMVIDFGATQLTLSPKDTGARLDVEAAVEAAFALEASGEQQYVALLPYLQLNTDYI